MQLEVNNTLLRNFSSNSSETMPGQEKQIFMGFVLNLQSHTHNATGSQKYHSCRDAGEQLLTHCMCSQSLTRSNAGSQ